MKKERIPLKGADEFNALTKWRGVYCYLTKPGVTKSIKKGYNKRFRQKGKVNGSIEEE